MSLFKSTSRLCVARQFKLVDLSGNPFIDGNVTLSAAENYTISILTLIPLNFSLMLQPFGHLTAEPLPFNIRIDPNLPLMKKLDQPPFFSGGLERNITLDARTRDFQNQYKYNLPRIIDTDD